MDLKRFFPAFRAKAASAPELYPYLRIHAGGPGNFVEHHYAPEFVFGDVHSSSAAMDPQGAYLLASYSDLSRHLMLSFRPKTQQMPVAALLLRDAWTLRYEYELPELSDRANYRQVASLAQYQFLRDTLASAVQPVRAPGTGMPGWGVALLLGLGLITSILLFSPAAPQTPAASASKPAVSSAPVSSYPPLTAGPALSKGDQLTGDEKATLAQVVKDSGIELSAGSKPFVIFSDPNCPACKALEGKLAELTKTEPDLAPVVVPVSFKSGSKEAVEGVLCAGDVPAAWRSAIGGGTAGPSCAKGEQQARTNNAAFVGLRFDSTPTIVTSSGKVAIGAKDFDGLVRWIKANSND